MGLGRGRGGGRGFCGGGRGWRNMFYATGLPGWRRFGGSTTPYPNLDPGTERHALQMQADSLQSELDSIKKRLAEIESKSVKE